MQSELPDGYTMEDFETAYQAYQKIVFLERTEFLKHHRFITIYSIHAQLPFLLTSIHNHEFGDNLGLALIILNDGDIKADFVRLLTGCVRTANVDDE